MAAIYRCIALGIVAVLTVGCATPRRVASPSTNSIQLVNYETSADKTIFVVGHGWHTGLVLRAADVDPALWWADENL